MIQSRYKQVLSIRPSKKGLFLCRTGQVYRVSVKHLVEINSQWRVRKKESLNYFKYRLRRNKLWYRACLKREDSRWAFNVRRCL